MITAFQSVNVIRIQFPDTECTLIKGAFSPGLPHPHPFYANFVHTFFPISSGLASLVSSSRGKSTFGFYQRQVYAIMIMESTIFLLRFDAARYNMHDMQS
jgi:hypothetical protein